MAQYFDKENLEIKQLNTVYYVNVAEIKSS